jgi:serine/threonine protein phosphatase PrpC
MNEIEITDSIKFMLLATDGLWDVMTPDETVEFVWANKHMEPNDICQRLVQAARVKGSTDNITAILVFFCNPKTDLREDI